jgi:hypothetical protein
MIKVAEIFNVEATTDVGSIAQVPGSVSTISESITPLVTVKVPAGGVLQEPPSKIKFPEV